MLMDDQVLVYEPNNRLSLKRFVDKYSKAYEKGGEKNLTSVISRQGKKVEHSGQRGSSLPNFWMSCMIVDSDAMADQSREDTRACWHSESGKSCPEEILDVFKTFHIEGRPIWKPMHLQPIYRNHAFITANGSGRGSSNAYNADMRIADAGADIFNRGLCLPSDIGMTEEEQDKVIEIVKKCFK